MPRFQEGLSGLEVRAIQSTSFAQATALELKRACILTCVSARLNTLKRASDASCINPTCTQTCGVAQGGPISLSFWTEHSERTLLNSQLGTIGTPKARKRDCCFRQATIECARKVADVFSWRRQVKERNAWLDAPDGPNTIWLAAAAGSAERPEVEEADAGGSGST